MTRALVIMIVCLALSSCSLGRRSWPIEVPCQALADAMDEAVTDPLFQYTECIPEDWWCLFDDEQLSWMIETALERNPTLEEAYLKIVAAKLQADQSRGILYPQISFGSDVTKYYLSETSIIPVGNFTQGLPLVTGPNIPQQFTQMELELNFTWDLDIWGKNRQLLASAAGELQATLADAALARLALSISIAQAYYRLQADYARRGIMNDLVEARRQYTHLVNQRVLANLSSDIELHSAQVGLSMAEQALLAIEGDIAVSQHQLQAYLAGDFDETFDDIDFPEQPLPIVPLPCELSLNLIAHRPDIISQLWIAEAASCRIEAAKAGFYPDINLMALAGYQSIHLDQLFLSRSGYGEGQAATTLPIFSGGTQQAQLKGVANDYNQAIVQYNNLILNATREILDALAVARNFNQQLATFQSQTTHQAAIYSLTNVRSEHHLASALDAIVSLEQLLQARDAEIQAKANTINATLALIKALGGGYESEIYEKDDCDNNYCFGTDTNVEECL